MSCTTSLWGVGLQAAGAAGEFRRKMHTRLAAQESRALAGAAAAASARERTDATLAEVQAAREQVRQLLDTNEQLKAALHAEEEWGRKDARRELAASSLGPVTVQVRALQVALLGS